MYLGERDEIEGGLAREEREIFREAEIDETTIVDINPKKEISELQRKF